MHQLSITSALKMSSRLTAASALLSLLTLCTIAIAQEPSTETAQAAKGPSKPVVPQLVRFAGALPNRAGDTVEAVFRIYSGAEGGEALWTETQKVTVAQDGSYSVLLGAVSVKGLPETVFGSGQARWLGVSVERGEEQSRTVLASAPYAMKAGDAQTLGGMPARSFVTQAQLAATAQALAEQASAQITPAVMPSGTGTTNYVPLWTSASNLGNSVLYQTGSKIGIGTTTPLAPLHVLGPATAAIAAVIQGGSGSGALKLGADVNTNTLTPSVRKLARITMPDWAADSLGVTLFSGDITGANNNDLYFGGTPNGSQYAATGLHFVTAATGTTTGGSERMTLTSAGSLGIGTLTPATKLEVNGTAKFDGLVTFASGQTFPGGGGGTITGITTTSPLTGSGTSGSVALGLNTAALETTEESVFDTRYALLSGGADFADQVDANSAYGSCCAAILGFGSNGSIGTYGHSDTGYGLEGLSGTGTGVIGSVASPGNGSNGVLGYTGSGFSNQYQNVSNYGYAGVRADFSGTSGGGYSAAFAATADDGYAIFALNDSQTPTINVENDSGLVGLFVGTVGDGIDVITETQGSGVSGTLDTPVGPGYAGVFGHASPSSAMSGLITFDAGVWGDAGADVGFGSHTGYAGVLGSADDWSAGAFFNNSANWPTLDLYNSGSYGIGVDSKPAGLFATMMATSKEGTCGIGGGSMSCTGPIKSLASSGGGSHTVETYAMQSSENWMEDAGSGELARGVALVHIDPEFAETISADASYHVFITPNGDSKGLYVIAKTPTTFEVRESGGGVSSVSFDYRIMAKRRGMETMRLADVTERFNLEIKHAEVRHTLKPGIAHPAQASARALKSRRQQAHKTFVPPQAPMRIAPRAAQAIATHAVASR